jgi:hypothetical protein
MNQRTPPDLNLTIHRARTSVWDRGGWNGRREPLTLSRWLVGVGGGALAVQGLKQRTLPGSLLAVVGGSLAWWALTAQSDLSAARRQFTGMVDRVLGRRKDSVHVASADSFPASDAPAWTPTVGTSLWRQS